ncbi:MAG: DedA family protein [Candidatus Aquicultorales bacterium]
MDSKIVQFIVEYFTAYGYYLVFFFLLAENSLFLGLVVPGDAVLLVSAFLAATGELDISTVLLVAVVAAVVGNNIGYFIGREGGRRVIDRLGSRWLPPERVAAVEKYFAVHGQKTVFIGRFVAGFRTFIPLFAGISKMSYPIFMLYTVGSVVVWTLVVGLLGFFFGENWQLLAAILKQTQLGVLALVLAVAVFLVLRRKRRRVADGAGTDSSGS